MTYRTIVPGEIPHREMHQLILGGVAPRPVAFVASLDAAGNANLSPFSFFNAYSSKPPTIAIGPAIAARTGIAKDTYLNILETGECTVNAVTFAMTEQMNLASGEYPRGVDEFVKAGFTKRPAQAVAPPLVAESPFAMECILVEHYPIRRDLGGNGTILILEAIRIYVAEEVLTNGAIDPQKTDLVGRMGADWYCRAHGDAVFEVKKPVGAGIGFDALPEFIRTSERLTGAELAKLAGVHETPVPDAGFTSPDGLPDDAVAAAKFLLARNDVAAAWQMLLCGAPENNDSK